MGGKIILSRNVTYDDLRKLILVDYQNNRRKSYRDLQTTRLPRLDAVFGGTKAIDVTTAAVERYKSLRLKDKSAPATVNRELAALKRMFRLGLRQGMVATMPYVSMLSEHNVRKGFFELDQFKAILKRLPAEYHALFELAYITGWRIRSELLTREWRHVDFSGKGWLRLDPGEAKDATSGREFQLTTWTRDVLTRQRPLRFASRCSRKRSERPSRIWSASVEGTTRQLQSRDLRPRALAPCSLPLGPPPRRPSSSGRCGRHRPELSRDCGELGQYLAASPSALGKSSEAAHGPRPSLALDMRNTPSTSP